MKISLLIPEANLITNHGYGVATHGVYTSLVGLGHEVALNDPTAPVEIAFSTADMWHWSNPKAHHVGYMPWESTRLPEEFLPFMRTADELWTTSPWCKKVFEKHGFENVRVYLHGVDALSENTGWERKRRKVREGRPIRFLHMGEPAPRKGGQLTFDTFVETFGDRKDVELTIKSWGYCTVRGTHKGNVKVIRDEYSPFELIDLVRRHDVLVYPSWGEGFGLIPLQAMVTGMPVICTEAWAPYAEHLLPDLRLPSRLTPSPWPGKDPGNMYEPDKDALSRAMLLCADPDEYMRLSVNAYANSFDVEKEYDWISLTVSAFRHLREKFETE